MDRIFFENIRCFAKRQEARLAPLTILVGENSSGKSTFLALVRLAWDLALLGKMDFNEEPFLLGSFDQIASRIRGKSQTRFFSIGAQFTPRAGEHITATGKFEASGGLPFLTHWSLEDPPYTEELSTQGPSTILDMVRGRSGEEIFALSKELARIRESLGPRPYAFAPVRTKPLRTYDPIRDMEDPEGSHIPMFLASMPLREPGRAKSLFSALKSFGQHSGLFEKVEVRRLGKAESDPFQIQVQIGGQAVNLIDVGYGVSQVLPIVVDCLRSEERGTFLLQQPEVHLHPRAQAELGSFLGVLAKQQKKRFVIETHSDYLVDRIRMDIRDKKGLTPADVSLLYFERRNGAAQIHGLELDEHGNILDPPSGYRSFFLEEERRLLGG